MSSKRMCGSEDFRHSFPDDLPGRAFTTLHESCCAMHQAIEAGDHAELTRLIRLVHWNVATELDWNAEKQRGARDPSYRVRHAMSTDQEAYAMRSLRMGEMPSFADEAP